MNTAAILNPNLIDDSTSTFGNQCIVAIDAKRMSMDQAGRFTHGGRKATDLDAIEWAQEVVTVGLAKFFSPVWIEMARKLVTTWNLPGRSSGGARSGYCFWWSWEPHPYV